MSGLETVSVPEMVDDTKTTSSQERGKVMSGNELSSQERGKVMSGNELSSQERGKVMSGNELRSFKN